MGILFYDQKYINYALYRIKIFYGFYGYAPLKFDNDGHLWNLPCTITHIFISGKKSLEIFLSKTITAENFEIDLEASEVAQNQFW
jgi:hypothetical protein